MTPRLLAHRIRRSHNGPVGSRVLVRETSGATALEFAILAVPFLLMLLFLFELGLDFYVQLALDYAVSQGARHMQTGAAFAAGSVDQFKTDCVCPAVSGFLNCDQIILNVQPLATSDYYVNAKAGAGSIPISNGTLNTGNFAFTPAGGNTPMFMQAIYTSVSVVGQLLPMMSVWDGTSRVHVTNSTIGFVNEPFIPSAAVCGVAS